MRAPWKSASDGKWSWTSLWLNVAALVTCVRFAVGTGVTIGTFQWAPGEMDPMLPTGILAALGALYSYRRGQEKNTP
jgi:hypothetical protein